MGGAGFFLIAAQALAFAAVYILARGLGPIDYGRVGLAMVFSIYGYQFVQFGIDPLLTRMLVRDAPERAASRLAGWLRQKQCAAVLALLIAGVSLATSGHEDRLLLFLGVLDGVVLALSVPGAFDARSKTPLYFAFLTLRQAGYAGTALLLTVAFKPLLNPVNVVLVHLACLLTQISVEWFWVRRSFGALDWRGSLSEGVALWRMALPLAISAGAWHISGSIGPPALEWAGQKSELGPLVLSNQISMFLFSLTIIPTRIIQARLAHVDHTSAEFRRIVWRYFLLFAVAGVAAAIACDLLAPFIVPLVFSQKYQATVPLLQMDAWRVAGSAGGAAFIAAFVCEDRLWLRAGCEVLAFAATIAVVVIFIPAHGAAAAAAAVPVGRIVFTVLAATAFFLGARGQEPRAKS